MPRGAGRPPLIGHAVDSSPTTTTTTSGGRRRSTRRRPDVQRRGAISLTLATVICLVVDVSGGDRAPPSSEDTAESARRRPTTTRVVEGAVDGMSLESRTSEDSMRPVRMADVSDSAENDLLPDVTQSVSSSPIITFRVSRRRRETYCGHARLCVCLSVCLSVRGRMPTLLHGPGCNLGQW